MIESLNTTVAIVTVRSSRRSVNITTVAELQTKIMSFVRCYVNFPDITHESCLVARVNGNFGVLLFLILY